MQSPQEKIILVVDDHDDGRESLCMLLENIGYIAFRAKNTAQALMYLEKGLRPCVVLLDLIMPGDGWHFRAVQMENPEWAKIPVVVGTGLAGGAVPVGRPVVIVTTKSVTIRSESNTGQFGKSWNSPFRLRVASPMLMQAMPPGTRTRWHSCHTRSSSSCSLRRWTTSLSRRRSGSPR